VFIYKTTYQGKLERGGDVMSLNMKEIGSRIRKQREFLGLTREQLAEMIDVTPKFCSDIELGVKGMSLNTLDVLSGMLKLSVDFILYGNATDENPDSVKMIFEMLDSCHSSKKKYAIEIMKNFIMVIDM